MSDLRQIRELHVLVVDDSAMVRQVMQSILCTDRRIRVTVAADPLIALSKLAKDRPQVVITDLEMPRMSGLEFIRHIMLHDPMPVIVCSGVAEKGARLAIEALREGAIDVITKPKIGVREFLHESSVILLDAVWSAAEAKLSRPRRATAPGMAPEKPPRPAAPVLNASHVIAIGASTGGPEAIETVLTEMLPECPPIVIVQHMPPVFTRAFAERLNRICEIEVKEAEHGDLLIMGKALIAPGGKHMALARSIRGVTVELSDGPLVSRHRPSVDVLMHSVAKVFGSVGIGVILTGMGSDGAEGVAKMKAAGATIFAQDEETSVVYGMPREAVARGCVDAILPLSKIAARVLAESSALPNVQ